MISTDTLNNLVPDPAQPHFDMCLAINEKALANALKSLLMQWRAKNVNKKIVLVKLPDKNNHDTGEGIEFNISDLEMEFNLLDSQLKIDRKDKNNFSINSIVNAKITFKIKKGKILIKAGISDTKAPNKTEKINFENLSFNFERILQNASENNNDSKFSLINFFIEFSDIKESTLKNENILIPNCSNEQREILKKSTIQLMHSNIFKDGLNIGQVIKHKTNSSSSSFILTDFIYTTNIGYGMDTGPKTLNILGVFSGKPLPDIDKINWKTMGNSWDKSGGIAQSLHGVLVISNEIFMKHIYDQIREVISGYVAQHGISEAEYKLGNILKMQVDYQNGGLYFKFPFEEVSEEIEVIQNKHESKSEYRGKAHLEFTMKGKPGTNEILLNGKYISIVTEKDEYEKGAISGEMTGEMAVNCIIKLRSEIPKSNNNNSQSSKTSIFFEKSAIKDGEFKITNDKNNAILADKNLENNRIAFSQKLRSGSLQVIESNRKLFYDLMDKFIFTIDDKSFVPPGGRDLIFKSPHFTSNGDLMLDFTFKSAPQVNKKKIIK